MPDDDSVLIAKCSYIKWYSFWNGVVFDWCISFSFCMNIIHNRMTQNKFVQQARLSSLMDTECRSNLSLKHCLATVWYARFFHTLSNSLLLSQYPRTQYMAKLTIKIIPIRQQNQRGTHFLRSLLKIQNILT